MACQDVQTWSLSGLVAAFLDLAIAYSLLCASAAAYLASKLLGCLGFNLPCPCHQIFSQINGKNFCLNKLLIDIPTHKISDVQLSVEHRFPFHDPPKPDYSCLEVGASCGSVSDARRSVDLGKKESGPRAGGKYDMKGKGVIGNRPKIRLRHRKNAHSSTKMGDRFIDGGSMPVDDNAEVHHLEYDNNFPTKKRLRRRSITSVENLSPDANMNEKKIYIDEQQDDNPQGVPTFEGYNRNTIRLLEQALEQERTAHSSLYIELEKERSAAASAADEAMAMILRLQEEKASIEIEARQYQRISEEKSAYDAEEIDILKEILVRSEKERLYLENEVVAYSQMVYVRNEPLDKPNSKHAFENGTSGLGNQGDSDDNSVRISVCSSVGKTDLQEKEIISADNNMESVLIFKGSGECQEPVPVDTKKELDKDQGRILAEKIIVTCNGSEPGYSCCDWNVEPESKFGLLDFGTSFVQMLHKDPNVCDVHIISDIRSSLSAVESEMLKIDCEIRRLREKLKLVREGSILCVESRERESLQLKLLEDIARRVRDIWQLNERGET
ncbi:hypothetical protein OROGR_008945 [Orobanche gracilis]